MFLFPFPPPKKHFAHDATGRKHENKRLPRKSFAYKAYFWTSCHRNAYMQWPLRSCVPSVAEWLKQKEKDHTPHAVYAREAQERKKKKKTCAQIILANQGRFSNRTAEGNICKQEQQRHKPQHSSRSTPLTPENKKHLAVVNATLD